MADKTDQIKINGTSYDIDLPVDAKPIITSLFVTNTHRDWSEVADGVAAIDSIVNSAFYSDNVNAKRFTITTTPTLYSNGSVPTLSTSYTNVTIEPYMGESGTGSASTFSAYIPSKDITVSNEEVAKSTFAYQGWVNATVSSNLDKRLGDQVTYSYSNHVLTIKVKSKAES